MKKIFSFMAAAMLTTAATAQETYDNAPLAQKDLNGTARYVGMGGAMEALGADISTMGTNPAGIGMFRRSVINGSFGFSSQSDAEEFNGADKTKMSFDQAGFVYSMRSGRSSFVNFGFTYNKSRNFNQILTAAGRLNGASQNKLSGMKNYNGIYKLHSNKDGKLSSPDVACSQLDYLYSNVILGDGNSILVDKDGNMIGDNTDGFLIRKDGTSPTFYNATDYSFGRESSGYIGEYNFNISGNSNDRFYWGLTFGLYDVHYDATTRYTENLVDGSNSIGSVTLNDRRKITGSGFDVKAGIIFRPVEESPFRVGLYVHTPTWYDLTSKNYTRLDNNLKKNQDDPSQSYGAYDYGDINEAYDFKFYTPWRFGASIGHTVGNYLALGATYEYADYSTSDIRINDGGTIDYWGNYYDESHSDEAMKQNIKQSLKGVHTLKLGMEFKPERNWAVRLGYNYVSPMYNTEGLKDGTIDSYGTYYSSTTDYTNWKATNRITAGVGYSCRNWTIDLAYQYSQTDGDFYPFRGYVDNEKKEYNNVCDAVKVSNKRNQLLLTLGYKF
ncbi:hemin receptor [Prevotella sp.]|uniref:hemin receptor n=1 Tax=Prevotella sp. TaxID=59823 RepID=UPI00307C2896